jgi:hypothetical protein
MSRAERQALVDWADRHHSIVRQCQLLKVARPTLYDQPAPVSDDGAILTTDDLTRTCLSRGPARVKAEIARTTLHTFGSPRNSCCR